MSGSNPERTRLTRTQVNYACNGIFAPQSICKILGEKRLHEMHHYHVARRPAYFKNDAQYLGLTRNASCVDVCAAISQMKTISSCQQAVVEELETLPRVGSWDKTTTIQAWETFRIFGATLYAATSIQNILQYTLEPQPSTINPYGLICS